MMVTMAFLENSFPHHVVGSSPARGAFYKMLNCLTTALNYNVKNK